MAISLYAATVPGFLQGLGAVSGLLDTAAAWCSANGVPESDITRARLAEDMLPFASQVRFTWLHSAGAVDGVFTGSFTPDVSRPPQRFAELKAGVEQAIVQLRAVDPAQLNALEGRDGRFQLKDFRLDFTAEDYLLSFAQPNFFFHATTAYAILRTKGLPLAKRDFLGSLRLKEN